MSQDPRSRDLRSKEPRPLKERILEEARRILLRSGFESLSMRRIASAVGCTPTSIYLYFPGKDGLVHALMEEGLEQLRTELEAVVDGVRTGTGVANGSSNGRGAEDARRELEALCRAYLAFGLANPEYYEIMFQLRPEGLERFPQERYRRGRRGLDLIADALCRASALYADDAERLRSESTLVWASLHGTVSLINAQRIDAGLDRDDLLERAVDHATRFLDPRPAQPVLER